MTDEPIKLVVPPEDAGHRLDYWLGQRRTEHSRSRWRALIDTGHVKVDGAPRKPNHRIAAGERVTIEEPPPEPSALTPEDRPLDILFEDADLLVLNKPPGLVIHPAPGHQGGTLVNALLHHCRDLSGIGGERRPGIVHRLDQDTSGVLVVAKSERAHRELTAQFKERAVRKVYAALVRGCPDPPSGTLETLIGRHPVHRKKMSVDSPRGRRAVTHYETREAYGIAALLRVRIETGRTHQIRVHLAHLGHPVIGDRLYGRNRGAAWPVPVERQLLHAETLAFTHPRTGLPLECTAPLPRDMRDLIAALRAAR